MSRSDTSIAAWRELSPKYYLAPREEQVMAVFGHAGITYTRQQLAVALGWAINCICGRVRSLLDKGALAVRGYFYDPTTRKHQELLGLPAPVQGDLFGLPGMQGRLI